MTFILLHKRLLRIFLVESPTEIIKQGHNLSSLVPVIHSDVIRRARRLAPARHKKNKWKVMALRKTRQEMMAQHKRELEAKKQRILIRNNQIYDNVMKLGGCWSSQDMMNENLSLIKTGKPKRQN